MPDNVTLNAMSGGATVRSVSKGGFESQVIVIDLGGSGAESLLTGAMPVTGTFWQTTQPVSLVTSPLPSGAATAAKQAALGIAGSPSSDVLSVQGIASMTALKTDGSGVTQPVSGTFWQATQPVSGTFWQTTQPVSLASAVTVAQATAASLNATVVGTGTFLTQAAQSGSWTVTANAGTNLNTSALALETGGHLAAIDVKIPALGQALAAASVPVVLTAAQLATLTPLTTVAVTGTFWQATQPVSAAALPLPTGASTAAKQPALGTAGTASSDVLTVQGIAAMTALKVDGSGVTQPVSGTFWQATQPVSLASAVTVAQATAASLNATVVGTGTFAVQATQSGTWNIGTVTTVTTVSTVTAVTAITNALPAGTNLLGQISASDETGTIYSGTTALTPKFATFSTSSSGATTVVALVNGKRLRVLRWRCTANGATNVKWQSHVTPTDISGLAYLTQFASAGGAYCPVGHFQTVSGEALDINNSNAIAISGEVTYIEV